MNIPNFDSVQKDRVRQMIHQEFREAGCQRILFFPSTCRAELDTLLSGGFKCGQLIAVEKHPQCMSNFTRLLDKKECRELVRIRAKVSDAALRLVRQKIYVDAANLDFCASIRDSAKEITAFVKSGALRKNGLLAIQVFAGRDNLRGEVQRLTAVESAIKKGLTRGRKCERVFGSYYKNEQSNSTMSYSIWRVS